MDYLAKIKEFGKRTIALTEELETLEYQKIAIEQLKNMKLPFDKNGYEYFTIIQKDDENTSTFEVIQTLMLKELDKRIKRQKQEIKNHFEKGIDFND